MAQESFARPTPAGHPHMSTQGVTLLQIILSVIICIYMCFVAAPRYEAEAKFVIRKTGGSIIAPLAGLLPGGQAIVSIENAHIAKAFLLSYDATLALEKELNLRQALLTSTIDPWWHLPLRFCKKSITCLHRQFLSLIDVALDTSAGITTVQVQAFKREDAKKFLELLLTHTEKQINTISTRAKREELEREATKLAQAKSTATQAQEALTEFRKSSLIIDPQKTLDIVEASVGTLTLQKSLLSAQKHELMQLSPQSPDLGVLDAKIEALNVQITSEQGKLFGPANSFASKVSNYDSLALDREIAVRSYTAAASSFELSRSEATRTELYLDLVTQPTVPDTASYPYRLLSAGLAIALLFALTSVARKVLTNIGTHSEL